MPERIFLVYYRFRSATMLLSFILFLPFNTFAQNVTLGWDPNDEPDLAGYSVYGSRGSPGPPYDYIDSFSLNEIDPENPQCEVTDLEENISYYFVVTAYDTDNNESEPSHPPLCVKDGKSCLPSAVLTDVKANGQDDPLHVIAGEHVNITISLDSGNMTDELCDWWGILISSYGTFPMFSFQTPLFDLAEISLLHTLLPPGWFVFVFNVEDSPDGAFQLGSYDYVPVVVSPAAGANAEMLPDFDDLIQEKMKEYTGK